MIVTATLCFALALTSSLPTKTSALPAIDAIVFKIITELSNVIRDADGTQISALELNNKLLEMTSKVLTKLEPEIKKLARESGESSDEIAKKLAVKINKSKELLGALNKGKQAPRFIGALALGITQIVTDVVKMALTRY